MSKIKDFFKNIYANITIVLGVVIGLLLYYINLKNKEAKALKARIALANTQKEADLLEAEINEMLKERKLLNKEIDDLTKAMVQLAEQRKKISGDQTNKTDKEIQDYWDKN